MPMETFQVMLLRIVTSVSGIRHIQGSGIFRTQFIQVYSGTFKHVQHYEGILTLLRHYSGKFRLIHETDQAYSELCHNQQFIQVLFSFKHIQNFV